MGGSACLRPLREGALMKVIRQICYECDEPDNLRAQLARSMPEGKRDGWAGGVSIEVRTVYSELPELEPFVPVAGGYVTTAEALAIVNDMMGPPKGDV